MREGDGGKEREDRERERMLMIAGFLPSLFYTTVVPILWNAAFLIQ
jgi:hypothetical protein